MESTCEFEKCVVARKFKFKSASECFNNVESIWHKKETGEQIAVCDCAPKRTLLMMMELSNRLIGVQRSQEQQRNVLRPISDLAEITMAAKREGTLCPVDINQEEEGAKGAAADGAAGAAPEVAETAAM